MASVTPPPPYDMRWSPSLGLIIMVFVWIFTYLHMFWIMIRKLDFCTDAYPPTGGYARPFYWSEDANVLDNWARHMDTVCENLLFIWVFKICRGIADEHASFLYFTTVSMTHRLTKLAPFWFYLFGFRLVPVQSCEQGQHGPAAWTEHLALLKYNWLSVLPQKFWIRDWSKSVCLAKVQKTNFWFAYSSITSWKVHNLPVCALRFSRTIALI